MVGISRTLGPISGRGATPAAALATIAGGNFDPRAFLGASTKIFGTIDLTELIPPVSFSAAPGNDQIDVEARSNRSILSRLPSARTPCDADWKQATTPTG